MRIVRSFNRRYFAVALFALACITAASAQIKISAVANTIQLQDGQISGAITLLFKIEGLKKEQKSPIPELRPLSSSQGGPQLTILGKPSVVTALEDGAFWQVAAYVDGLPLNSSFVTPVLVRLNSTGDVLSYTVTNVLSAVDADVSPGDDTVFLQKSRDTDFTVNVKGRPLRGLSVCQSTLADTNTGNRLGDQYLGMYLGPSAAAENPQTGTQYLTLSAPSTKVHLLVSPAFQSNGVFAGTVGLCSASKASVATLKLNVNSSSWIARSVGAFLILLGIAVYVLVAVVLRQRSRQLTALLPASRLVEAMRRLQASARRVAHKTRVDFPILLGNANTRHSLEWLIAQLSEAKLRSEGLLPPLLTNPFQPADIDANYQKFLQAISTQELNCAVIVGDGLERVMSLWYTLDQESAREAFADLDQLALDADSTDAMRPKVEKIVNGISHHGVTPYGIVAGFRGEQAPPPTPSVHEISIQLEHISAFGWVIWAVLSFLTGCGVLILSNHGFGNWQDLSKCFLWGLGVQAAGQGLQALTPASAVSTFSLQIGH